MFTVFIRLISLFALFSLIIVCLVTLGLFFFQDHQSRISRHPLLEGGDIQNVHVFAASEAPEVEDSQDGDEGKDSLEDISSMMLPPPALSEDCGIDKKRKHVAELLSSSTLVHTTVIGKTSAPEEEVELFDLLDS
jgi:hypothetical protein